MMYRVTTLVPVHDQSQVAEARRSAVWIASQLGLSEQQVGNVGIVSTELATNLLKHAGSGELWISPVSVNLGNCLDLVATDNGPGFTDIARALEDGYSTAGSSGTGLGAVRRLSSRFDVVSLAGTGAAVHARFVEHKGACDPDFGVICLPLKTERVSGDNWFFRESRSHEMIAVVDGLGHGPGAAEAADAAVSHLKSVPMDGEPVEILKDLHGILRTTRGAAISICRVEKDRGLLRFAGVGNVAASVVSSAESRRSLPTNNGTIGHSISRIQEFCCPVNNGDFLVMHSDGLISSWELPKWPGLWSRTPALIAALVCCKNRRERDDATVVVRRLGVVA